MLQNVEPRGMGVAVALHTYDANGNRVAQDVTPSDGSQVSSTGYRFDAADRLTKVSRPGFSEAFTLDGAGRRVATKTSTGVGVSDTETVFDGLDPVAQTGGAAADRTMLGGVEMGSDGSVSWKLTDRAGDVVAVTGADGGVVAMAGYSDFGVTKTTADWDVLTAHSGELSDPTVGMDLYYRRAYDPLTANWGQADPYRGLLSAPQSLNRYAFVNGNPVTSRDVLGFSADAAEHYGSGAQSFFRSQHNAPRAKRKIRKTVPSPSPKPRVTQSADSLEKSSNPTGKCGPKCRQRQADGGRPGVGFRNLDRQEGNQPHGRAPKRHKHDDGFCLLGHNDDGSCVGSSLPWRGALQVGIFIGSVGAGIACGVTVVCGVGVGVAAGGASYIAGNAGTDHFSAGGLVTEMAIGGLGGAAGAKLSGISKAGEGMVEAGEKVPGEAWRAAVAGGGSFPRTRGAVAAVKSMPRSMSMQVTGVVVQGGGWVGSFVVPASPTITRAVKSNSSANGGFSFYALMCGSW